ncbi:hypothetical protein D3C87_2127990 [compost metagenome]
MADLVYDQVTANEKIDDDAILRAIATHYGEIPHPTSILYLATAHRQAGQEMLREADALRQLAKNRMSTA